MKQVGCRDMGVNCDFVAKGNSNDEIKKALWTHAEKSHAEVVKSLTAGKRQELSVKMDEILNKPAAAPVKR